MQFAYSLLTRSQRISHENLRLRDRDWLEGVERWFWSGRAGVPVQVAVPPMFAPFELRELELANRDRRLADGDVFGRSTARRTTSTSSIYGARAQGGAGLVFTEMTCVCPEGRITPGCTGM